MAAGVMYPTMQDVNNWGEQVADTRGMFMGTPEIYFTKRIDNSRVVRVADPKRRREMLYFGITLGVFFLLVMVYLLQHLSAIEYGYRIEAEKQQLQQLEEQNRQLRLTEAQLDDPARIDQMARQLGLAAPRPGQVVRPDASVDPNAPVLAEATPVLPAIR